MGELLQLSAFDDIIRCNIEDMLAICTELGEPLIEFGFLIKKAFDRCRDVIEFGLLNSAPDNMNEFFQELPLAKAICEILEFRNENRKSPFFNHLSTVSESICALNWITLPASPCQFIRDLTDAGQYFGNRVLAAHKGQPNHVSFVNKWTQVLKSLEMYVKQHFLTGFTWGAVKGGIVQHRPDIPPPPPPPCLPVSEINYSDINAGGDGAREALIRDLNQGSAITSRLKHVDRKEKAPGAQTSRSQAPPKPTRSQETAAKPRKFMLEGRKWVVENCRDEEALSLDNDMSQSLAMFKCEKVMLTVNNKINNISIDSCKKVSILIKSGVISCVEVINCEGLKIQCDDNVPLVNISGSNNVQVFVTEKSKNIEVISSMSSSINMCLISTDGDYLECPVPEQIKSVFDGSKLKSSIVETI